MYSSTRLLWKIHIITIICTVLPGYCQKYTLLLLYVQFYLVIVENTHYYYYMYSFTRLLWKIHLCSTAVNFGTGSSENRSSKSANGTLDELSESVSLTANDHETAVLRAKLEEYEDVICQQQELLQQVIYVLQCCPSRCCFKDDLQYH